MISALALIALEILFGLALLRFFDFEKKFTRLERLLAAVVSGVTISNALILFLALLFGSLTRSLAVFLVVVLLVLAFRFSKFFELAGKISRSSINVLRNFRATVFNRRWLSLKIWFLLLGLFIALYGYFLTGVFFRSPDGFLKGNITGWGDSALHIDLIERFAAADPFTLKHPLLAGNNLTYPFFIDFISGVFYKLGADIVLAYRIPLFLFGIAAILLVFCLARRFLKSSNWAALAVLLVFLGSGFGFFMLFDDVKTFYQKKDNFDLIQFLKNPPHEYTHLDDRTSGKLSGRDAPYNIVWMAPVVIFMSHQRSFVLGLSIVALTLLAILVYGRSKYFYRYGILAGLLPFIHAHSLVALFFIMATLFWFEKGHKKDWLRFAFTVALIAIPELLTFSLEASAIGTGIFRPWTGWMTCGHSVSWIKCDPALNTDTNVLFFWAKNFGLIFLIWSFTLAAIVLVPKIRSGIKKLSRFRFFGASLILFAVTNLFLLQPWDFDNNKAIFYWWILAVLAVVTPVLKFVWSKNFLTKSLVVLLITFSILSGTFDFVARLFWAKPIGAFGYADGSKENRDLGEWIKNNTRKNDLFLTNLTIDPVPIFLAGRPVYIAFEGWFWTHGLNSWENRRKAGEILKGDLKLACEEKIQYILVDNGLRDAFPEINQPVLFKDMSVVFRANPTNDDQVLLKVNCD